MKASVPGEFCWVELAHGNTDAALAFYCGLFGWSAVAQELALPGRTLPYSLLKLGQRFVASTYPLLAEQIEGGVTPSWMPYLAVESVETAVHRAEELGAICLVDPSDILQAGRVAILEDPAGATIGLWQARNLHGFRVAEEPGVPAWFELAAADVAAAAAFYGALFGWTRRRPANGPSAAVLLARGDRPIAGVVPLRAGAAPGWATHFGVADCDASSARIRTAGGSVERVAPHASGARSLAVVDPQGAPFSIVEAARGS